MREMLIALSLVAAGCGLTLDLDPPDERPDASGVDAGRDEDAGREMDAGRVPMDGGDRMDSGPAEAGLDGNVVRPDGASVLDAATATDALVPMCRPLASGCYANSDCGSAEFCMRPVGDCLGPGSCFPAASVVGSMAVCGCDGSIYADARTAAANRISVAYFGACMADTAGTDDWCPGFGVATRDSLLCDTIWQACFDDDDCQRHGMGFPYCVGASGCSPGDEGVCVPHAPASCFRSDLCGPGQRCEEPDISPSGLRGGRCRSG